MLDGGGFSFGGFRLFFFFFDCDGLCMGVIVFFEKRKKERRK
jgi:hypothetical protein